MVVRTSWSRFSPLSGLGAASGSTGTGVTANTRSVQTAMSAFPWSFGVHIRAIPLGDVMRDEAILAVVVASDETAVTATEITAWCQQRLIHFRLPQFVRFRSELPRTAVGKIQKHILREQLQS